MASRIASPRSPAAVYGYNSSVNSANSQVDGQGQVQSFGNGGQPTDFDLQRTNVDSTSAATSERRAPLSNNAEGRANETAFRDSPPPNRKPVGTSGQAGFGQPNAVGDRIAQVSIPAENAPWVQELQRWKLDGGHA